MSKATETEHISRWNVGMDAVYLMACALHGTVPAEDFSENEGLFSFCNQHSITAMVAMAMESYWQSCPPENRDAVTPWRQAKEKAIRKNILLNAERQRILAYLDSIGCWYLPMKGSFLQYDYPRFGMRQMSDNDILYDTAFENEVYDFMCSSGYTAKAFGKNNHDEYIKPPVYNFEMHRRLFSTISHKQLSDYYSDIRCLMVKDAQNLCGYHLTDADFYVYMTAHAYRHFSCKGTGIRSLADVYVFLDKHGENLDWGYVETELEKLSILDYERQCRSMARKLFEAPQREILLTSEEQEFLGKFLGTGIYGSWKQAVENTLDRMEREGSAGGILMKLQYFWQRLFPSLEWMADIEPDLLEHRWKLPFAYIRRLFRALTQQPLQMFKESVYLVKSKRTQRD